MEYSPPQMLKNSPPDGVHYLAEFFGCCPYQINSLTFWETILSESLEGSSIQILHQHFYSFDPHGVTGYFLLSASHISVHTWPEHGYIACDIFSCSGEDETEAIVNHITSAIKHERTHVTTLRRGYRFGMGIDTVTLPPMQKVEHCDQRRECQAAGLMPPTLAKGD